MGGDHTHKTAGGIGESLFTDNKALCIALGQNRRQVHIPGEQGYTGIYAVAMASSSSLSCDLD